MVYTVPSMSKKTQQEIINLIGQAIYDKKGSHILALDVTGLSTITDIMVIAEGNVDRHVSAIGWEVIDVLHKNGVPVYLTNGLENGEWAILDLGGIMVHIFTPSLRQKYCLEQLWPESKLIDVEIDTSSPLIPQLMR